jgi:hypothetical protein
MINETNYSCFILNRSEGFSYWLTSALSLQAQSNNSKPFNLDLHNFAQIDMSTKSDAAVVLYDIAIKPDLSILIENAGQLLMKELRDWIDDETLWPVSMDSFSFFNFFNIMFCERVFNLHENGEPLVVLNQLKGDQYNHHFSFHFVPNANFLKYINKFFIKQNELPMRYDNKIKSLLGSFNPLFLLPKSVSSYEEVTKVIHKNYQDIHNTYLTLLLKKLPNESLEVSLEEFNTFYNFSYHSRLTTLL